MCLDSREGGEQKIFVLGFGIEIFHATDDEATAGTTAAPFATKRKSGVGQRRNFRQMATAGNFDFEIFGGKSHDGHVWRFNESPGGRQPNLKINITI